VINLKNLLVELEFKTPEDFAAYKKKHKMRPGTVVKVAGKDKVVGDETGKKSKGKGAKASSKAQAFAAISNLSDKDKKDFEFHYEIDPNDNDELQKFVSGMDDSEAKQVMKDFGKDGDIAPEVEPKKVSKAPKTPTFVNDDGDVVANDFDSALDLAANLGMSDEELDYIEKEKDMESLGDYLDGQGYSQKQEDEPKGKKTKTSGIEFSSFGEKDIKRFADRYGVEVKNIRKGQQGNLADFEGDPEKIKKMLTSTQYGMEPEDADDLIGTTSDVDQKTDKDMASAADKANMKMDRDEIMGALNAKNEPFAEEVYDILYDKFKKMGSLGKELEQEIDTLAAYESGIYDMSEKEYEQGRKDIKKKLGDYYKKELDEGIKGLSKIKTRYNR